MNTRSTNTTTLTAPDITCGGCANSIKNALSRVDGVESVDVDIATKQVSVAHGDGVSREKIVEVLDRAGFPSS
ncbi:MAG: heavy-metal-associated domain-containing protein [Pyrinomonadaceae bacterium]